MPGNTLIGEPIKKCHDMRAVNSLASVDIAVMGLELSIDSIWVKSIVKSSSIKVCLFIVRRKRCFSDFMEVSQRPLKCGAGTRITSHSIPYDDKFCLITCVKLLELKEKSRSEREAMKLVDLFVKIFAGCPRRAQKIVARQAFSFNEQVTSR